MSKILAVFGATGQQGSSIIHNILNDASLSQQYTIRGITRNTTSPASQTLAEKISMIHGDITDSHSLRTALTNVHTVFIMTPPDFSSNAVEIEYHNGKTIVDVAIEMGVQYIIFSTLPHVSALSQGKYTKVTAFDAKAKIEQYIRSLPIKSSFISLGSFMQNFQVQTFLAPRAAADESWVISRHTSSKMPFPLLDAVGDAGKFVGAILASPDKYQGETFCAAAKIYTLEEIIAALSKSSGRTIVYEQVSAETFKSSIPFAADMFAEYFSFCEEFGYWGPGSEEKVMWAIENARGKLATLEEFLEAHPYQLA
ncbi:putative hscarg dehydrogenase protein [Botrytis fragariae]|uniref:Putative hscarg dehydrogenase protein n=1 Tax=Botrytis fragariae TaxID=1964551 RepID=A0A8H6ATF0_9HELO|nr:putative hscarg dehydrogenase protein [Botrytis fragariae]KAF5873065.1 putative hscarg dehydrogenase protein [Botrytis fragariae]